MKKIVLSFLFCVAAANLQAQEEQATESNSQTSKVIKVQAQQDSTNLRSGTLPSVYKDKIYNGKKSAITNLSNNIPASEANNTRQIFQESSGVIVSDVNNQSYYSIGIRGIGDPHESQGVLLMSDSIPLAADFYGYPAAYYLPSLSSVESVEVTKTGAGLLYGSQPGGSLNYRLIQPKFNSALQIKTINTFGSDNLFTTHNSIESGNTKTAYRLEAYQKSGTGQFQNNSAFNAYGFEGRFRYKLNDTHELKPQISYYKGHFEEGGGLALTPGAGRVTIDESRTRNTLSFDELLIERIEARLAHEYKMTDMSKLTSTLWGSNLSRESRRQNGTGFGTLPTNNTNSIQDQDFYSFGAKIEMAKDYKIGENNNTFTSNMMYYKLDSPIEIGTGATADADKFTTLNRQLKRSTEAVALAVENLFTEGSWAFTPAVRFESIKQSIDENFNGTPTLRNSRIHDNIVLGGLGITYDTAFDQQVYFNISEGFRPVQFSESVPTSSNIVVNSDLKSSKTLAFELGVKGQLSRFEYDASAFNMNYNDQLGTVTGNSNTTLGNVGRGQYQGLDLSARYRINENFLTFINSQFLNARFKSGPLTNKTPAYAPSYLHKIGVQHETDTFKHQVNGSFAAKHYSDDNNNPERIIPAYEVFDFSGQYSLQRKIWDTQPKITYGVNNVLDLKYYSRIRATGIEPALGRNYFAGFEATF